MRVEFKPMVVVAGVAGFALGYLRPIVIAQQSGGSGSGGDKKMTCDQAHAQLPILIAVAGILLAGGGYAASSFISGYGMGCIKAACPEEDKE